MPDVAREAQSLIPYMADIIDEWRPVPDYEQEPSRLFAATSLPGPDEVDPLTIEPLTAVDDGRFVERITANQNIPNWMKDQL